MSIEIICAYRKHLVSLVQHKHLHRIGLEDTTLDHVLHTSWCTDNDLRAILESFHIVPNACSANTCMALNIHEITDGDDHFLDLLSKLTSRCEDQSLTSLDVGVQLLQDGDRESCGLSCTGLCLCDDVGA